jgi:hypothetical protein
MSREIAFSMNDMLKKNSILWLFILFLLILWVFNQSNQTDSYVIIPYTTFKTLLQEDNIAEVNLQGDKIKGSLRQATALLNSHQPSQYSSSFKRQSFIDVVGRKECGCQC